MFYLKKKKKQITKSNRNQTHGHVTRRANQTSILAIQSKPKPNPNTKQTKPQLVKCLLSEVQLVKCTPVLVARSSSPQLARSRPRPKSSLPVARPSSQTTDHRSQIAWLRVASPLRCSMLGAPSFKVFLSLFLSDS